MDRIPRAEVPEEQKWNSTALFSGWDAVDAELQAVVADMPKVAAFQGRLFEGANVVAEYLEVYQELVKRIWLLETYIDMAAQVDTGDERAKSTFSQYQGIKTRFRVATAFAEPEMVAIADKLIEWSDSTLLLAVYRRYFAYLKQQANHARSSEVEELLGLLSEPFAGPRATFMDLVHGDLLREDIVDSEGTTKPYKQIATFFNDKPDRNIRQQLHTSNHEALLAYKNTLTSNYLTGVRQNTVLAKVRKYDSVLHMQMEPAGLPVQVFHNLVDAFKDNLETWHRYWDVKRRILGVGELHPFDIHAPLVDNPPKVSFEQAVEWTCDALKPLGEEYVATMRKGCLEDGWVDRACSLNKANMAFSCPSIHGSPPYIMVAYDDSFANMSALAHELGHSMNHYRLGQRQPVLYNGTDFNPMFSYTIAETHSNFHQIMTRNYLRKVKGDDEQFMIAMIDEAMMVFHRYFFLMPNLARFEYDIHNSVMEGKPVNATILMDIMSGYLAEGYGNTMKFNPGYQGLTWAQMTQVWVPFYSFQYSIGISAAYAIADDILAGKEGAVENYLEFAALGTSKDVLESFDVARVDMRTREPIDKAFAVLADLVDQLEALAI